MFRTMLVESREKYKSNYKGKIQQWKAFLLHTKAFSRANNRKWKYLKQIVHESNYINQGKIANSGINHHSTKKITKTVKTTSVLWQPPKRKLAAKCDKIRQIQICSFGKHHRAQTGLLLLWSPDIMTFLIWSIETNELQALALLI